MDFKNFFQQYLNFVKRYIPEPRVHSSVGIDIGLSTCKMIEVKPKAGSFEILRWGIEPFEKDPSENIKAFLAKTQNPYKTPAAAVHGKGTLIRYVEVPRMPLEELKKSFVYEADKYLPFTFDQVYLDCMVLDPKSKTNKMTVMAAAAKKEIVDKRIAMLENAGIKADFITLNPIAMANVINTLGSLNHVSGLSGLSTDEAAAIVDIGERVTSVNIVYGGVPHFTRDVFIGGLDFSQHLSNTMGVSLEEAEALKCNPGKREEEVAKACESVVLNLISDMRLSFDYFVTEHNIPITKILLAGGASLLDGMPEMFKNYLEIDVSRWDFFEYIEMQEELKKDIQKFSGQLGVALGLALY